MAEPPPKQPFNMVRACFWLIAGVIAVEVAATMFAGLSCFYLNMTGVREIGACLPIVQIIREQWAEILAAIFALLLAARSRPPDDKE